MHSFREIDIILNANGITGAGVADFYTVQKHLLPCRGIERLPKSPQSILIAPFPIKIETEVRNLARFAAIPDYHKVVGIRLQRASDALSKIYPGYSFVPFVDSSPIPEVRTAELAGIGRIGRHGLLITKAYGSWVMLGEIVTDLQVQATTSSINDHYCINCGKCRYICPLGSLDGESFQRDLCVSHITQTAGTLSEDEKSAIKKAGSCWGCDLCQDICPLNIGKPDTPIEEFYTSFIPVFSEDHFFCYNERVFSWKKPDIIKRNLGILLKN